MKKRLILYLLLLASGNNFLVADEKDIAINRQNTETRSIIYVPEASVDTQTCILSISFQSSGIYYFYITNNIGEILYEAVLPANGLEYCYDLSGIGDGFFRLVIEGKCGEYEGFFTL